MSIYITKHAIKRFYERFPKEWKKLKCINEQWQETSHRHPYNIQVLENLFNLSQEIKNINNNQGYLIWQQERHNKHAKYYIYKDIVFIADETFLYTVLDKNQALPHIRNVKSVKNEVINTRHHFERYMEIGHPSFEYLYLTTLNEYYDIYEVKNHIFSDFVRVNRYNFSEKHKLTEYEYGIVDTILLWNNQDDELIQTCIAQPEEYCITQWYDDYIFHWILDGGSLYWSYNTIEHNIQVLWGTELMKVLMHLQEKENLEKIANTEPLFFIENFKFYECNRNYILMHENEKVSDITGRDFQLFNAVKYMIDHGAPGYASFNAFLLDSQKSDKNPTFYGAINKYLGRYLFERARPTVWSNLYLYNNVVLYVDVTKGDEVILLGGENVSSYVLSDLQDIQTMKKESEYIGSWHDNFFYRHNDIYLVEHEEKIALYGLPHQKTIQTVTNIIQFYERWFEQKRFDIIGGMYEDAFIVRLSHISQTQKKYLPDYNRQMLALWNPHIDKLRPIQKEEYTEIEELLTSNHQLSQWLEDADIVSVSECTEHDMTILHVTYNIKGKIYECHVIDNTTLVEHYSGNNSMSNSNGKEDGLIPNI